MQRRLVQVRTVLDEVFDSLDGDTPFSGSDEGDYHVHAAALACNAAYLLTNNNPTDFTSETEPYEIVNADDFFEIVGASQPAILPGIIREQVAYWPQYPRHMQLDEALRRAGCPIFASRIRGLLQKQAINRRPDQV